MCIKPGCGQHLCTLKGSAVSGSCSNARHPVQLTFARVFGVFLLDLHLHVFQQLRIVETPQTQNQVPPGCVRPILGPPTQQKVVYLLVYVPVVVINLINISLVQLQAHSHVSDATRDLSDGIEILGLTEKLRTGEPRMKLLKQV